MDVAISATVSAYYDLAPTLVHRTGDIWRAIPSHGMFRTPTIHGLVITPSCDLTNNKTNTITYLPIVPVADWVITLDLLPEFERSLLGLAEQLESEVKSPPPIPSDTNNLLTLSLTAELDTYELLATSKKAKDAMLRYRSCLKCIGACHASTPRDASLAEVRQAIGTKSWSDNCARLLTNSLRTDVHFLPADGQGAEWSAVPEHSVVLFRCPMTAPRKLFDLAQSIELADWESAITSLTPLFPIASAFTAFRPLKAATLRKDYLHDLLTRFGSLYLRVGSPDFTSSAVKSMVATLNG